MSSGDTQEKILDELRKIREAVEPKPSPPPVSPKGFGAEFRAFLDKYSIIGLALAVIIGGAAGRLVSALVADILMPVITFFIPGGRWRGAVLSIGAIHLSLGHFAGEVLDFLVIALLIFIVMKRLEKVGIK